MDRDTPDLPPEPPQMPAAPRPWGEEAPVEVPTPIQAAPRRRFPWVAVIVGGIALVAIVLLLNRGGGDLPDRVGGQPRVSEGPAAEMLDAFEQMDVGGVSIEMAIYGPSLNPAYMVMLFEGDVPQDEGDLLSSLPPGLVSGTDAQIDFSQQVTAEVDGTQIACAPATNTAVGMEIAMCLFAGEDVGGVVMSIVSPNVPALMATTQQLVADLG
jgi:hypothetical protein